MLIIGPVNAIATIVPTPIIPPRRNPRTAIVKSNAIFTFLNGFFDFPEIKRTIASTGAAPILADKYKPKPQPSNITAGISIKSLIK